MSMTRRHFTQLLASVFGAVVITPVVLAELQQGRDWRPVEPPQPPETAGRIEVLEFFSYGCPHCGKLNPLIQAWAAKLPADVGFQRVPVSFGRAAWANLARSFYALELSGDLAQVDSALFNAIGNQRLQLYTEADMAKWLKTQDVDAARFSEQFEGFAVETRFARGEVLAERYQVDAVPTIIVGGRYAVVGQAAKGYEDLLRIADELIARVRAEGTGAPPAAG